MTPQLCHCSTSPTVRATALYGLEEAVHWCKKVDLRIEVTEESANVATENNPDFDSKMSQIG